MDRVAVCPRCGGERKVYNARSGKQENCPTCDGDGVKWQRDMVEAAESDDDHRDLTFRP